MISKLGKNKNTSRPGRFKKFTFLELFPLEAIGSTKMRRDAKEEKVWL